MRYVLNVILIVMYVGSICISLYTYIFLKIVKKRINGFTYSEDNGKKEFNAVKKLLKFVIAAYILSGVGSILKLIQISLKYKR